MMQVICLKQVPTFQNRISSPAHLRLNPALQRLAPPSLSSIWFLQMRLLLPLLTLVLISLAGAAAQDKPTRNAPGFPGPTDAGAVLPNGWRVTPAGEQVLLAD